MHREPEEFEGLFKRIRELDDESVMSVEGLVYELEATSGLVSEKEVKDVME